jgi:dipeptidyl aminopeptidase/acylaminoacyl peptidase
MRDALALAGPLPLLLLSTLARVALGDPAPVTAPAPATAPATVPSTAPAATLPAVPLEVYGRLPHMEEVALSPDGTRLAFVRTEGDTRLVSVVSLARHETIAGLRIGDDKLRRIAWADDHNLMIVTSATALPAGFNMQHEWSLLQVLDVDSHKVRLVPAGMQLSDLNMLNVLSGLPMARQIGGHTVLFVPGMCELDNIQPVLFSVDLDSGHEKLIRLGSEHTSAWLVDEAGEVAAQEDYDQRSQRWSISVPRGGKLKELAGGREAIDIPELLGFGPDPGTLLVRTLEKGESIWRPMSLSDGTLGAPMSETRQLEAPIADRRSHRIIGGAYVEDSAQYQFFDPALQRRWDAILRAFPNERVHFESASADFSRIVLRVDGPVNGYVYELVDMNRHAADVVGAVYDGIKLPHEVRRITYPAADGMQIPGYLTLPRDRPVKGLPLVVLPHGGPEARDTADFDWWSQALADQGYAVLRPNYRGSTIDHAFVVAGFGQWGRKMQTDLSDGVRYLVAQGIVDPARVCIAGASYGGYAALAGVTLDPGVYRCAIAVAGLSDLKRMLVWVDENSMGQANIAQRYWDRFMGVKGADDPALDAISPIKHLDAVNVPVLLIHGKDDTVVPYEQSEVIYDALRRAKKPVSLVTLKHEDHWLSRSDTRLLMLKSTVEFLRANNPPD